MYDIKVIIGFITVLLTFIGYVPYLKDTIKGKTKPHVYSWFIWGFITLLIFSLQYTGQAGAGSYTTFAAGVICIVVFLLAFRNGKKDITKADTTFFILALIATAVWIFAKQPVISVILLSSIDMLGFVPTIRKSWNKPYSETLFMYALSTFRFILTLFALQTYTIVTSLYPITWTLANGGFSIMLIIRRKQITRNR